jgi:hypothetical protein
MAAVRLGGSGRTEKEVLHTSKSEVERIVRSRGRYSTSNPKNLILPYSLVALGLNIPV